MYYANGFLTSIVHNWGKNAKWFIFFYCFMSIVTKVLLMEFNLQWCAKVTTKTKLGPFARTCNPSKWEADIWGWLEVRRSARLHYTVNQRPHWACRQYFWLQYIQSKVILWPSQNIWTLTYLCYFCCLYQK